MATLPNDDPVSRIENTESEEALDVLLDTYLRLVQLPKESVLDVQRAFRKRFLELDAMKRVVREGRVAKLGSAEHPRSHLRLVKG